jgi:hypothetical protein
MIRSDVSAVHGINLPEAELGRLSFRCELCTSGASHTRSSDSGLLAPDQIAFLWYFGVKKSVFFWSSP